MDIQISLNPEKWHKHTGIVEKKFIIIMVYCVEASA